MDLEELMHKTQFFIVTPGDGTFDGSIEDPELQADMISSVILKHLAGKLESLGAKVTLKEDRNVPATYAEACEEESSLFISLKVGIKTEVDKSVARVSYFDAGNETKEINENLADELAHRFKDTGYFTMVESKSRETSIKPGIPSALIIIGMGNDLLCDYNDDQDKFLIKIVESIGYGLVSGFVDNGDGEEDEDS